MTDGKAAHTGSFSYVCGRIMIRAGIGDPCIMAHSLNSRDSCGPERSAF